MDLLLLRGTDCFALPLPASPNLFHFRSNCSSRPSSFQLNRLVDELFRSVSTKKSDAITDYRLLLNRALSLFELLLQTPPASDSNSDPIVPFGKLLTVLTRIRCYSRVVSLSRRLDFPCNVFTLSILINCFCHLNHLGFAMSVLGRILKLGLEPNTHTLTTLIKGFYSHGHLSQAVHIFRKMVLVPCCQPNVVTYSVIIDGLCKLGQTRTAPSSCLGICSTRLLFDQALYLFSQLLSRGIPPDVITYTCLIHGASNQWKLVTTMLNDMADKNISPCLRTYTVLVDAFCKDGKIREAQQVVKMMIERRCEPGVFTYNALMNGYCLQGEVKEALQVFQSMASHGCPPNVVSYTTMICGFFNAGKPQAAEKLLLEMQVHGLHPNIVTVGVVFDYLCKNKRLKEAMSLARKMENHGLNLNIFCYSILIDGLCKVGKLEIARDLFRSLPTKGLHPNVWTHNMLINGLCKHGLFNEAELLFSKMEENGCSPNEYSCNTMIRGFIQNQERKKAIQLIDIMVDKGFSANAFTTAAVLYQLINDEAFRKMILGA